MGRLAWIPRVSPVESQGFFKVEEGDGDLGSQRHVITRKGGEKQCEDPPQHCWL